MKKLDKQFLQFVASFKSVDEENMVVRDVVASDDSEDRHGDRVNPEGWDLKNYKKNPIILVDHDYRVEKVIGTGSGVKIEDNKLVFSKITFSKTNDLAVKAFNLIKEGILRTWSVGFLVKKWGDEKSKFTIQEQELLELSLVAVPANPNAMNQNQLEMVEAYNKSLEEVKHLEEEDVDKPEEEPKETPEETPDEVVEEKSVLAQVLESEELKTMIADKVAEEVKAAISKMIGDNTNLESDEQGADTTLLALNAVRQELIEQNRESGKTLKAFNQLLSTFKKE